MTHSKPFWASKTLLVNGLTALGAILLLATKELTLTPDQVSAVLFGSGVINILLRLITTQPIE